MTSQSRGRLPNLLGQQPGEADAEPQRDVRQTFLTMLGNVPGGTPVSGPIAMVPRGGGFLTRIPGATALPAWLTEADIDFLRRLDPFTPRDGSGSALSATMRAAAAI
jgi:hypothetical protein